MGLLYQHVLYSQTTLGIEEIKINEPTCVSTHQKPAICLGKGHFQGLGGQCQVVITPAALWPRPPALAAALSFAQVSSDSICHMHLRRFCPRAPCDPNRYSGHSHVMG